MNREELILKQRERRNRYFMNREELILKQMKRSIKPINEEINRLQEAKNEMIEKYTDRIVSVQAGSRPATKQPA